MDTSVQVVLLNVPPETLAVHVTAPVGAVGVPGLLSVTVTVSVSGVPCGIDALLGDTVAAVVRLFIVIVAVPELDECVASPE